jgi:hypothetical protein
MTKLKRTAPEPQEPSKEGYSPKGDAWMFEDICHICGKPAMEGALTNKCEECIDNYDGTKD